MKCLSILGLWIMLPVISIAQSTQKANFPIPDCQIKTIDGSSFNTATFNTAHQQPFVICFWQSCCSNNLNFMDSFNDLYEDIVEDIPFKVYAVSVDDSRSSSKVKSMVNGKGWGFEFYLDPNSDFKRAINVSLTPHCFVFDKNGNLIWQKSSFLQGDEYLIEEVLESIGESD